MSNKKMSIKDILLYIIHKLAFPFFVVLGVITLLKKVFKKDEKKGTTPHDNHNDMISDSKEGMKELDDDLKDEKKRVATAGENTKLPKDVVNKPAGDGLTEEESKELDEDLKKNHGTSLAEESKKRLDDIESKVGEL